MKTMQISSRFTVTDFKTGKSYQETIKGVGQDAIKFLRREYPKFSKFVLNGFEFEDGEVVKFKKLRLYNG